MQTLQRHLKSSLITRSITLLCLSALYTPQTVYAEPAEPAAPLEGVDAEHAQDVWDDVHKKLQDLGERVANQEKLPESSILHPFRNNKKRNQKKVDKLTVKLLESLGASPLDPLLKKRRQQVKKRQEIIKAIAKLEESRIGLPEKGGLFKTSKADVDKKIKAKREELKKLAQAQEALFTEVRSTFKSMGLMLTPSQVRDLFGVISGDTMRGFFVQFSNLRLLSDIIDHLLRKNTGPGYSELAKRYYAIYVALIYMLVNAHEATLDGLSQVHLPKVRDLMKQTEAQMQSTRALLQDPKHATNRTIYEENLAVQRKLAQAAKSYEGYLLAQSKKISEARDALKLRLSAVLNTYQTVTLSTGLVSAIRAGVRDIGELQTLGLPKLLPLSDEKLQGEFEIVGRELSGDQFDIMKRR